MAKNAKMETLKHFERALRWVDRYTIPGKGIAVNTQNPRPYPEVTGYYIPTLLAWNERSRAEAFGRWLLTCQREDGYWTDPDGDQPYAFDTGQILKGFLALAEATGSHEYDGAIRKACEWMCSCITASGEPDVPDVRGWGDTIPLGILLYAFEPVRRAAERFGETRWRDAVDRSISWFLARSDLTAFTHLSHFHAYILEALCDLGHPDRAREGMETVARLQRRDGAVPGYANVKWVCSTGLFQYAIVWYKLGDRERGDRAFAYATRLQNRTGGWYGSYGWFAKYFPKAEIAWAVKYFFDALQWHLKTSFETESSIFPDTIEPEDGRYRLVRETVCETGAKSILDAGCGKGRYLRNLRIDCPDATLHGADFSPSVMKWVPQEIPTRRGSLLQLPYKDASFDLVYTVEALEHAVHIDGALRELLRVLKPGGTLLIIDKDVKRLGALKLAEWEQWFDVDDLAARLQKLGCRVSIHRGVPYDGRTDDLFVGWVAVKAAQGVAT